jgi:hypothetical protein
MCTTLLFSQFEEKQEDIFFETAYVRRVQDAPTKLHDSLADSGATTSLLPKRLITVFGTESSGSTFTATAIGIATGVKNPNDKNGLGFRSWDFERNVEVQHISLPTGYGPTADICFQQQFGVMPTETQTLPVVLPAPCMVVPEKNKEQYARAQVKNRAFPEACREEAGLEDFVIYPTRFFVNVTSHIQWYRERGVEATAVVIMRDASISKISKIQSHCPLKEVAEQQNEHARQLMTEAIDKLDPSREVVLVSYEGMMSLGRSYLLDIYRQLGINSTYTPSFKDGNAKYVVAPEPRRKTIKMTYLNRFKPDFDQVVAPMSRPITRFKDGSSTYHVVPEPKRETSEKRFSNRFKTNFNQVVSPMSRRSTTLTKQPLNIGRETGWGRKQKRAGQHNL